MSTIAAGSPILRSDSCCGIFAPPIRSCGSRALIGCRLVTLHSAASDKASETNSAYSEAFCIPLRLFGVLNGYSPDLLAGDDEFLDLRGAIANLQAHHIGIALIERQVRG